MNIRLMIEATKANKANDASVYVEVSVHKNKRRNNPLF